MKERPILFSGEMVRAILEGRKTQTRRVIRDEWWVCLDPDDDADRRQALTMCPHGQPGDRLWVRETWASARVFDQVSPRDLCAVTGEHLVIWYAADGVAEESWANRGRWRSSLHMPRWASRLTLEVTSVRVERLQGISEDDAQAEGVTPDADCIKNRCARPHRDRFLDLWDELNAKRAPWRSNPWVWVVSFRKVN